MKLRSSVPTSSGDCGTYYENLRHTGLPQPHADILLTTVTFGPLQKWRNMPYMCKDRVYRTHYILNKFLKTKAIKILA